MPMGSKQSKVAKTPFEILGVPPTATREEIREKYRRTILEIHPDIQHRHVSKTTGDASEVIAAYAQLTKSLPPLEEYTEELFRSDMRKYGDDLFERISDYFKIRTPKFSSPDFERFYYIFTNFTTAKEFETKEERDKCCRNVRRIARMLRQMDGRMCDEKPIQVERKAPPPPKEKKIKTYPIQCDECSKGFHSTNQLLNHLRSRKHLERVSKTTGDPRKYVEDQILRITGMERAEEEIKEEHPREVEAEDEPRAEEERPRTELRREPLPFRTCSRCRLIFDNRAELFVHLRVSHRDQA
jgi:curved DNA-binding protein CbpA